MKKQNLNGVLQEINGDIYLPITDLQVVYDLEIKYSKNSNRIIIDTITKEKVEATISKRSNVKSRKGLFASNVEKLIIGDKVVILMKLQLEKIKLKRKKNQLFTEIIQIFPEFMIIYKLMRKS